MLHCSPLCPDPPHWCQLPWLWQYYYGQWLGYWDSYYYANDQAIGIRVPYGIYGIMGTAEVEEVDEDHEVEVLEVDDSIVTMWKFQFLMITQIGIFVMEEWQNDR